MDPHLQTLQAIFGSLCFILAACLVFLWSWLDHEHKPILKTLWHALVVGFLGFIVGAGPVAYVVYAVITLTPLILAVCAILGVYFLFSRRGR